MLVSRIASRMGTLGSRKGVNLMQTRKFESKWDDPHEPYTGTGGNLPINIYCNRYALLFKIFVFCASGFWYPFMSYHYLRLKGMR